MLLPDSVKQIRARYIVAFPLPQGVPGEEFEERARQWTIRFAEQVAFELPHQGWGMKRADPTRPISKDTIARLDGGRLFIWDLLIGTGTGAPRLSDNPESDDITGQTFVEVQPTNHLNTPGASSSSSSSSSSSTAGSSAGTVPQSTTGGPADLSPLVEQLAAIRKTLEAILKEQKETRSAIKAMTPRGPE